MAEGDPIVLSLPQAISAYKNKYTDPEFLGQYQALPPVVQQALTDYDTNRVMKGQMPLSAKNSLMAGV